jgi:hypothetical protein
LYLINQQFDNGVCLVHSSYPDSCGGKDFAVVDGGEAVAHENQARRDAFCFYFVAFTIAGQSADGNYFNAAHFCQHRFDNHLFGLRSIEALGDNVGVGENPRYVVVGKSYLMALDFDPRVYSPEVLNNAINFGFSDLVGEELLPVEVALLDEVEVGDYEFADACACKGDCDVGAKPAEPGYAND